MYKAERVCPCGYSTQYRSNWCTHAKRCALGVDRETLVQQLASAEERARTCSLQLDAKQEQVDSLVAQLEAKDRQIEALVSIAKKPRVQHTTHVTLQNVNVFGKESCEHISSSALRELLREPETSIERLVALKLAVESNRNVRVRNVRDGFVDILVEEGGAKKWRAAPSRVVVSDIVESNALILEGEADDSRPGQRYSQWHDRLKSSQAHNGTMFREQLSRVHRSIAQVTR